MVCCMNPRGEALPGITAEWDSVTGVQTQGPEFYSVCRGVGKAGLSVTERYAATAAVHFCFYFLTLICIWPESIGAGAGAWTQLACSPTTILK